MSRVDKYTDRFETKEVHGQLVKVRVLKPHKSVEDKPDKKKRPRKKRFCFFCETEIFDAGESCDLCGRDFYAK